MNNPLKWITLPPQRLLRLLRRQRTVQRHIDKTEGEETLHFKRPLPDFNPADTQTKTAAIKGQTIRTAAAAEKELRFHCKRFSKGFLWNSNLASDTPTSATRRFRFRSKRCFHNCRAER
jgi:hypothetical protein